jgi:nucleotidyltransferase substrate binding protein (TIGR01987 family)
MNMRLDLTPLKNALQSLDLALAKEKDEFIRDSVIQRFEFTYELSWKFLSRHLALDLGSDAVDKLLRRDLYRTAAEKGLIKDSTTWFEYHTARNTTSHTYNVSIAEQVYEVAQEFSSDAHFLLDKLVEIHK